MRALVLVCVVGAAGLSAGCAGDEGGGGDPFEGVYGTTLETENPDGCAAEGPEVAPYDPFFELKLDNFFGTTILGYRSCDSAEVCDDESDLFGSFSEKRDGNWTLVVKYSTYGGSCTIGETIRTLLGDPDPDTAILTRTESSAAHPALTESECMDGDLDELVEEYRDDMTCESLTVVRADRLE